MRQSVGLFGGPNLQGEYPGFLKRRRIKSLSLFTFLVKKTKGTILMVSHMKRVYFVVIV